MEESGVNRLNTCRLLWDCEKDETWARAYGTGSLDARPRKVKGILGCLAIYSKIAFTKIMFEQYKLWLSIL
ncbi:hypothetical protein NCCP28_13800 [Niallia sp. NCCP-28]|nr:hypothetical protein NCCP28_13800 [Niallia sp. NCCP-28]